MTDKLDVFDRETNPFRRNRLLFDWLRDDEARQDLYRELRDAGFRLLQLKSLVREPDDTASWPSHDLYVVSGRDDVAHALQHYSVQPYASLDSQGRFMLGIDDRALHDKQKLDAVKALTFSNGEIEATAREAVRQACVRPFKTSEFDLVGNVAQQAGLRFVELLFGLPPESHVHLELGMAATYERLIFQIIGRHFVTDPGLAPLESPEALALKSLLEAFVNDAATATRDRDLLDKGLSRQTVISRLFAQNGSGDPAYPIMVALGLMAGTVGNITAAVSIAIDFFFDDQARAEGTPSIGAARAAARAGDRARLAALIDAALNARPAAPFLTRVARADPGDPGSGARLAGIPDGALVLLALGADSQDDLRFGWQAPRKDYPHRCAGQRFVMPLVVEAVMQVLLLPGLSRVIAPDTGLPMRLRTRWGAICESFPLQFQRTLRLNQQPLHVVLPIKEPVLQSAYKLEQIIRAGAHIVEDALAMSKHVHFAWFNFDETRTHLCMSTAYDGEFDAYVEFFALLVPLFDLQFNYLDVNLPRPIREYPNEFVNAIRQYHREPIAGYFFSAYPLTTVADIANAGV
ncbi:hypothetical protein [Scleromatobacter humisilvae]|uniref:Cytochrome P450 n=1 Tax=Scleromatobacter humisilvae TaxID=2897159 RepID=A0A9X1YKS1_9BURK|nr:hypothetical protein [Scleromatobacter humisilvae]MCK9686710.1 cytochrome P450 [Scleromatobacter humisilvae]